MKVLCVFGRYQYGDKTRGTSTEYSAFVPALSSLGHEVIHFESWDRSAYKDFSELNRALLETVERERPQILLVVYMLYEVWIETIDMISSRGDITTICWTTDDSWKYVQCSRFVGKSYHVTTTTYPQYVSKYHADGIPNVFLTQWAASESTLAVPLPALECRYKVTFVGAAHGDRKKRIKWLRDQGVDVVCYGHGWPEGSLSGSEMSNVIRDSIISLNFSNSIGDNQLKARNFEVPGTGGFLITEYAAGIEQYYVDGEEVVVFRDMEELARKIEYYLNHTDERDKIARNGFERTRREHTYTKRMHDILEYAREISPTVLAGNKIQSAKDFSKAVEAHRLTFMLKLLRATLWLPALVIFGKKRANRALRRILFELSWRISGAKTYSAAGLPGRMYYNES